ncbi:apolipoprotein N-acyltransferase [Novosphingobium sp. PC22D]|uniref:apolipoprotein N-acyltransferase n=1 Tax=Novosphingobium sp. PC22D TaxID=1962403 RepID=UPI000BF12823|nr:apolipoprotein N-acyltransferase [Novosphingobium sp. PC22D]PEQ14210.1 apolipoprotein N-acyltransferase [Novosphingobium sp. PC22D]
MIRSRQAAEAVFRYRRSGAIVAGALTACGFQPLALWPLALLGLAWLAEAAARSRSIGSAFAVGWFFGLGHFTIGNNWIATAFTYQAEMPQWLGSIAVILLSLYLAIFPALATAAAWAFVRYLRARRGSDDERTEPAALPYFGLVFAACWIVTEWTRAWLFTGFAWNPLAVMLVGPYDSQGLALLAPWLGTYALSGLVVGLACLLRRAMHFLIGGSARERLAAGLSLAVAAGALGTVMLAPAAYLAPREGAIRFTLIQPDLRQETLDDPRNFERHFIKMARLTVQKDRADRRVVFWPESGLADYLRDGYPPFLYRLMTYDADPVAARERIGRVIGPYSLLLTGAVDIVIKDGEDIAARNSVTAIDWRGSILAGYSKAHLVPFGEYLPLRYLLEPLGLTRLVAGTLDFWPGPGPRTYNFGAWGKAGIQICYEIVFSGEVVDPASRPDYIFNPSNDGWFGAWGPPQHLAQARLRAIEEGLPILRSTTTGISAVIDADGIVRGYIPRHTANRIDGKIPPAHPPTPFARFGNLIPLLIAAALLLGCAVALRRATR